MKRRTRYFLFLLSGIAALCAVSVQAQTTYYVSTTGSDGSDGKSLDHPFATIGKAAAVMKAGDRCQIRQGIYRETVKPAASGAAAAPMTFEAYGNDLVYISGADPVIGWTQHQGGIYKASMPWNLGEYKNQIIVDGKMAWNARSPNVDAAYVPDQYLDFFGIFDRRRFQPLTEPIAVPQLVFFGDNGGSGSSFNFSVGAGSGASKLPADLFNHSNDFFKGGLLTVHGIYWIGTGIISGSSSSATNTSIQSTKVNSMAMGGEGAGFISHVFGLLDAPNEWFRDNGTQMLYLWAPDGANPSNHLVEAKRRGLGFDLTGKQYVTVKNLRFIATSMTLDDARNCTIEGCQFKYVAHNDALSNDEMGAYFEIKQDCSDGHLGIYLGGSNNAMKKCLVRGSNASGVVISGHYCSVTNSIITDCNYSPTYHAGILVIPNNGDWTDVTKPKGTEISNNYFAYHMRACIQVGGAANGTSESVRMKIHNNNFGAAVYGSNESGQIAIQSCTMGEIYRNYFHDVGFFQMASICGESDFGGQGWRLHHNVFYQGDSSVFSSKWGKPTYLRCCDWTPTPEDDDFMCFNNTIVDSSSYDHWDWETMSSFSGVPWTTNFVNKNNLWGWTLSDTASWKYTNPVKRDYSLRAGSPAIDKGVAIPGWVETYKGAAPDLGAYEYGETPWVAGPDWQEQAWVYPPPPPVSVVGPMDRQTGAPMLRPTVRPWRKTILVGGLNNAEYRVTVFNAAGIPVVAQRGSGSQAISIDAAGLAPGIYVVRLFSGGRVETQKALVR